MSDKPKVRFHEWFMEKYGKSYGQSRWDEFGEGLVAYVEEAVASLEAEKDKPRQPLDEKPEQP